MLTLHHRYSDFFTSELGINSMHVKPSHNVCKNKLKLSILSKLLFKNFPVQGMSQHH